MTSWIHVNNINQTTLIKHIISFSSFLSYSHSNISSVNPSQDETNDSSTSSQIFQESKSVSKNWSPESAIHNQVQIQKEPETFNYSNLAQTFESANTDDNHELDCFANNSRYDSDPKKIDNDFVLNQASSESHIFEASSEDKVVTLDNDLIKTKEINPKRDLDTTFDVSIDSVSIK